MKKSGFIFIFLLWGLLCNAQVAPESFIDRFPTVPDNVCGMNYLDRQEFLDKVKVVSDEITEILDQLNEEIEENAPEMEKQAMNRVAQQYGFSAADMQKLQDGGKLSEQEQRALANKMLQNSMNISMGEVDNLKNMSKEGREAWAQAYSTEIMADAQADPDKYKNQQLQTKSLYDLSMEQKHLLDSLTAIEAKFGKQFDEIYNSSDAIADREEIDQLELKRSTMVGSSSDDEMEEISNLIKDKKHAYCAKLTPGHLAIIQKYIDHVKTSLPAYYRLEQIENKVIKAQTGVDINMKRGHLVLGKVSSIGGALSKSFTYNLFTGFDRYQE